MRKKIFISAFPYCATSNKPIKLLKDNNFDFVINNKKRRLNESEIKKILPKYDALIADTEPLTKSVLSKCDKLKIISRVGIGLNNVDLITAKNKNIKVAYTPDAVTFAVVELTIGLIFNLLRKITIHNNKLKNGIWQRELGRRISDISFGIIGYGRIGSRVARILIKLGAKKVYYNDVIKKKLKKNIIYKTKEFIYKNSDLISLHVPLNHSTDNLINKKNMKKFKKNIMIINTSRGEVVNELDLAQFLNKNLNALAACDVFLNEPYQGVLQKIPNCIITPHIGSMSVDCREKMEYEATDAIIKFFQNKKVKNIYC